MCAFCEKKHVLNKRIGGDCFCEKAYKGRDVNWRRLSQRRQKGQRMKNDLPPKNYDAARGSTKNDAATKNEFGGNPAPKEFYDAPDNYGNTHGAAKAVMTLLAASLVAVLLFGGAVGGTGADITVQISSTTVTFSEISYAIDIPADASGLTVAVYNSLTRQERALSPGVNTGTFKGLGEDRTYTLEVISKSGISETVYATKKLHTMKREG